MVRAVRAQALPLLLAVVFVALGAARASARVVQVPVGGRAVPVVREGVVCGPLPAGWSFENERRSVRPPPAGVSASRTVEARTAPSTSECDRAKEVVTLVAFDPLPEIDPGSVAFWPDEGRLELRGQRLKGLQIVWGRPADPAPATGDEKSGKDSCLDPTAGTKGEPAQSQHCVVPLERGLRFDTPLHWLPAGAHFGPDVTIFDASGGRLDPAAFALRPARTLVSQLVPSGAAVDVAAGPGRVPLVHPQAVTAVDCGVVRCELAESAVVVRSVPSLVNQVSVRLRLAPRTALVKGDGFETQTTIVLPLLQCPLSFASGPPLRDADDTRVVLRMDTRCAKEQRLQFYVNGDPVDPARTPIRANDGLYVELKVGRLVEERVTVTVTRGDVDATIVGTVSSKTVPAPRPRVTLELRKHGKIAFVPTNRDAVLKVAAPSDEARLVPLSEEGAYQIRSGQGSYLIRGDETAGGFVTLLFAYRMSGLPAELAAVNLAVIPERTQRAVREASVPAPFGAGTERGEPLAQLVCSGERGEPHVLSPGTPHELPHRARHTCRVVIHGERIDPEFGAQEIELEVEVTSANGTRRAEASFSRRLVLLPQSPTRAIPLKGGFDEFDQLLVRLSVVLDESRYALNPTARDGLPAVQWSAVVEGGSFRLYATAAIPAGLYRMNQPTGQLTLNFGVLSRVTWLDRRGKESLLGLEVGLMGMGLIQRPGAVEYKPTLGAIAGTGIRVPLGPGGAAVGVHVWGAYEFRESFEYRPGKLAPRLAFIFGPSISIGNVGTNF